MSVRPSNSIPPFPFISSEKLFELFEKKDSRYWEETRKTRAVELFHAMAERVPAYKHFLKKHKLNPNKVKTYEDFVNQVPIVTKHNYINEYPLKSLAWDGNLRRPSVFTSTSGSTGEPTFFYRSTQVDYQGSIAQEFFIKNAIDPEKSTLVIICFGMGIWIGGLITFSALQMLSERGYPLSLITPGINKSEILRILKRLSPQYEQTIIYGYPPFMKDIIDEAVAQKINLKKLNIRISTAAEAYTESFRDYICKQLGIKDPILDTMNIYGSADIGAMAFETPRSIAIRRLAHDKKEVFDDIFNAAPKTPTLAQYVPHFISFESINGELVLTGDSAIPLVRYSIGDRGGVYSYNELKDKLDAHGIEMPTPGRNVASTELPFVYVFERNDFSTTLYGAQIYPEAIREVLIKSPFNKFFTGKFTLATRYDRNHDQYLEINFELQKDKKVSAVIKTHLMNRVKKSLMANHSEYRELVKFIGSRANPKFVFYAYEDPKYFKPGIKQSWIRKS